MKRKETLHQKYLKYEKWMLNPKYIEQEYKAERLMDKLIKEITL